MQRFAVLYKSVVIGHSELEFADPPMGVSFGELSPLPSYFEVRSLHSTRAAGGAGDIGIRRIDGIEVHDETGAHLECLAAFIEDCEEEIFVWIEGVPYPLFEDLFPHHVAAYHRQFSDAEPDQ